MSTAYKLGWSTLKNGELLDAVESTGFEVFVTTDTNLADQQNLSNRKIAIGVISITSWPRIQKSVAAILSAIDAARPNVWLLNRKNVKLDSTTGTRTEKGQSSTP